MERELLVAAYKLASKLRAEETGLEIVSSNGEIETSLTRTDPDGYMVTIGFYDSGVSLELWRDNLLDLPNRHFWIGFCSEKLEDLKEILKPWRSGYTTLDDPEYRTVGRAVHLRQKFSQATLRKPFLEKYHREFYFGIFDHNDGQGGKFDLSRAVGFVKKTVEAGGLLSRKDAREKVEALITRRQGQPDFRRKLMRAYGGKCAISGCPVDHVLDAAHIMPFRGDHSNKVANGLILRTDLHTLFDRFKISIEVVGMKRTIRVAPSVRPYYKEFDGRPLRQPRKSSESPSTQYLQEHHREAQKRQK